MANQFLSLSLFIMLLAFFIVLNTFSNFEEMKSRPVLDSLAMAFASKELADDSAPSTTQDSLESYREGDTLDKLEALFRSQITGFEARKNRLGTVMHIRMPLKKFEKEMMSAGRAEISGSGILQGVGKGFASTLISLLQARGEIPYRMDMVVNVPDNPSRLQNENPQFVSENIRKVTGFSLKLERAGLPRKLITAGLGKGQEGTIELFFRRYEPFNPLGEEPAKGTP